MIQRDRPLLAPVDSSGPRDPGLHLLSLQPSLAGERSSFELRGRLLIPREEGVARALAILHGLSLTVIGAANQGVSTRRLIGRVPLALELPPVSDAPELCGVDFSVDFGAALGGPVSPRPQYVVLGARELVSELLPFEPASQAEHQTETMVRGLSLAYTAMRQGNFEYVMRVLRSALGDETAARDLDGAHLYHGACAACLLADQRWAAARATSPGALDRELEVDDDDLVRAAMTWLDREAAELAAAWDRLRASLEETDEPALKGLRARQLDEIRARVRWMRHGDPDLERLRGQKKIDPRLREAGVLERLG